MGKRLENGIFGSRLEKAILPRMTSPFVGRDDELRCLAAALTLATQRHGSTILLTGPAGIGKTRLARQALALAMERGFTVLEGRALPLQAGPAYAPFLAAFRPLLRNLDPALLDRLVDGLPSLGSLLEGLRLPPSEPLCDPALAKARLFEAVLQLFGRLIEDAPVVLFIDDLQWAEPATLDLLHYLVHGLADQRALLLASYCEEASADSRALRSLVASLDRAGLVEEVNVPRLGREEADELVRGMLGGEIRDEHLALLYSRGGGVPLFVEMLVASLIDSGHLLPNPSEKDGWTLDPQGAVELPPSVRRLVRGIMERQAPADRRVLNLIAVMGDATFSILHRLASDLQEEALVEVLQRLRAAGLVVQAAQGSERTHTIAHPLIQEVAYAEQPEMDRERAHLAAIKAIESLSEGQFNDPSASSGLSLSRLARHYLGAGTQAPSVQAVSVLVAAGEQALATYDDNEEAARYFEAALRMIRDDGGESTSACPPGKVRNQRPQKYSKWWMLPRGCSCYEQ